jgi:thymidylate kinase
MELSVILEKLGYETQPSSCEDELKLMYFPNPDGTVRWFWPVACQQPYFLKFFNVQGKKAMLFTALTSIAFKLGLQRLLFKQIQVPVSTSIHAKNVLPKHSNWAAFTGTPGPTRKAIIFSIDNGQGSFQKVAIGESAATLLENEKTTIHSLANSKQITFSFPQLINRETNELKLSEVAHEGMRMETFSHRHEEALLEIRNETASREIIQSLPIWKESLEKLSRLQRLENPRIPKGILRKLEILINSIPAHQYIATCLSHGDFTPWNMYADPKAGLAIYDWECAKGNMPFCFDAFHFIIQNQILVKRNRWSDIERLITAQLFQPSSMMGDYTPVQQQLYLKLYLIINTIYYLTVYQEQINWHIQVEWLINTWNEALSSMLMNQKSNRELLLMDLNDFLSKRRYAALKHSNEAPEKISELSDLDLFIDSTHYQETIDYFHQHILIKSNRSSLKSFMASEHFILKDGGLLCLDFIWKLKRKQLEMPMSKEILDNAKTNSFGLKVADAVNNARYIAFFFALNNAIIPQQYLSYQNALWFSKNPLDQLFLNYYQGKTDSKEIRNQIKHLQVNRGGLAIRNWLNYIFDTIREFARKDGMVITLSGVDGAGKSTVIEKLKSRIEKQLRRRVIVLRHRPSILPILSAWKKGRVRAEEEAANRLPRQGRNKNIASSLARFFYYYLDYLLGQWYIAIKYVFRGYVVLYDRYYFDFITDSRRSNIELPTAFARWAYAFVQEPDYNFFLFAKPDLILARKQELSSITIEELTNKYLSLFEELNASKKQARYISVENIELDATLQLILSTIKK